MSGHCPVSPPSSSYRVSLTVATVHFYSTQPEFTYKIITYNFGPKRHHVWWKLIISKVLIINILIFGICALTRILSSYHLLSFFCQKEQQKILQFKANSLIIFSSFRIIFPTVDFIEHFYLWRTLFLAK